MAEGSRILVVEDNAAVRHSLTLMLEREGFDVVAVAEFRRATELIDGELFDAMITDLDLPGGTGLDLLQRARTVHPRMRSFLMTGYGCSAIRNQVRELGVSGYFEKPFDPEELLRALGVAPQP